MDKKKHIIIATIVFVLFNNYKTEAQVEITGAPYLRNDNVTEQRYNNSDTYKKPFLLPDYFSLQYAGDIGFMSIGGGYFYNKNKKVRVNISIGIVPKRIATTSSSIITLAHEFQIMKPIKIKNNFEWSIVNVGAQLSYYLGNEYNSLNRGYEDKYYYLFSTNIGYRFYFKTELLWLNSYKYLGYKKISFYFESGRNATDILTSFKNRTVNYFDSASFGFGLNLYL